MTIPKWVIVCVLLFGFVSSLIDIWSWTALLLAFTALSLGGLWMEWMKDEGAL